MIKNIILDVDGTLWDTTDVVAGAWNKAAEADGRTAIRTTGDQLKTLFGKPMDVIAKNLFTDVDQPVWEKLLVDCCEEEHLALEACTEDLCYPGVKDTMRALAAAGRKLFIVSNCQSGYIELFLRKNDLEETVADIECFGNNGLSKGENILLLMERNGVDPADTVYVGDTLGDYEASVFAKVPFAFITYGFGKVETPDYVINAFSELKEL